MQNIALLDETLDINLTQTYHLSIQTGLNGFSFCILDSVRNKFIGLKHFVFDENLPVKELPVMIAHIIKEEELLKKNYKSVKFIYISQKSALIPAPLFSKDNFYDVFTFNHAINQDDALFHNRLENLDAYNVFSIPVELVQLIKDCFPKANLYHQATPMIENLMINHKSKSGIKKVFINLCPEFFDIAVIEAPSLTLYNTFIYKNEEDFAYFVMYIFDQMKLSTEETEVILSGSLAKKSSYYKVLTKFIRNLKFDKISDHFTYSYTFNDIPAHSFVNLLNVYLCES